MRPVSGKCILDNSTPSQSALRMKISFFNRKMSHLINHLSYSGLGMIQDIWKFAVWTSQKATIGSFKLWLTLSLISLEKNIGLSKRDSSSLNPTMSVHAELERHWMLLKHHTAVCACTWSTVSASSPYA